MHSCFIEDTIKPDQIMKDMIEYQTENLEDVIQLLKKSVRRKAYEPTSMER